ncbi:alpha-tocopherol transfer protein-like [Argiope bruennichi]|uniref:Alpha-tocopherol transfer protein-like like protein n=1 Tax=Argiope bruennichi TaxID=94029 RepID=A0A8T0ES03_ARGBR|nr:alpha-tocopherol transfer protein-like [Argiope bruennichi]KAF8778722.1 Alpha-tocopherol transfer protein-like like protein [Argiope bruennichi]
MFIRDPKTAKIGEEILPFEIDTIPEYFLKKAEAELGESTEKKMQGLREIRELAQNDKHTRNYEFDDDFLIQYLRARKYNATRAFTQLKALVQLKKKNPQIFTDFNFEKTSKTINDKTITLLPWRCQDGCAILLIQLDNWYPETFPVEEVKRACAVWLMQSLREPMTQINGFKAILDVKSNPFRHLRHCTPNNIWLIYHGSQECVPGRYKEVHIVNTSATFKAAWFIIKSFMSDKLKKRIIFHNNSKTLINYFPKEILPTQYGGELEKYDMTSWLRKAMAPEKLALIGGTRRESVSDPRRDSHHRRESNCFNWRRESNSSRRSSKA